MIAVPRSCSLIVRCALMLAAVQTCSADQLTAEKRAELKADVERYSKQAQVAYRTGDFDAAATHFENLVSTERQLYDGPDNELIVSLEWLAHVYEVRLRYPKAIAIRREIVQMRKALLGPSHYKLIEAKVYLAECEKFAALTPEEIKTFESAEVNFASARHSLASNGNTEAFETLTESLQGIRRLLGTNSVTVCRRRGELSALCLRFRRGDDALDLMKANVSATRETFGKDHPETAKVAMAYGIALSAQKTPAMAREAFEEAVRIYRKMEGVEEGELAIDYARALNILAVLQLNIEPNGYHAAEPMLSTSLGIHRRVRGNQHLETAFVLHQLARCRIQLVVEGDPEPLLLECLGIQEKNFGEQDPRLLPVLEELVGFYLSNVRYQPAKAKAFTQRRISIAKSSGQIALATASMLQLAKQLEQGGEFVQAADTFRQCADLMAEHHETSWNRVHAEGAIGRYAFKDGRVEEAESRFMTALHLSRTLVKTASSSRSESAQIDIANRSREVLDHAVSVALLSEAEDRQVAEQILLAKGAVTLRQRRLRLLATDDADQSLLREHEKVTSQLSTLVRLLPPEEKVDVWLAHAKTVANRKSQIEEQLALRQIGKKAAGEAESMDEITASLPEGAVLLNYIQFTKMELVQFDDIGRLGLDVIAVQDGAHIVSTRAGAPARTSGKLQSGDLILSVREENGRAVSLANLPINGMIALLNGKADSSVTLSVKRRDGTTEDVVLTRAFLPPSVQARSSHFGVVVLTTEGNTDLVDLGPAKPIVDNIELWRTSYGTSEASRIAARELRQAIWEPIQDRVSNADLVLISPEAELCRFPFPALPGTAAGRYLLEEHRIATIPIPALLPALNAPRDSSGRANGALLVGDIDYNRTATRTPFSGVTADVNLVSVGRSSGISFSPLKYTGVEVRSIATLIGNEKPKGSLSATVLTGSDITEERFRKSASASRYVHLATHGFFQTRDDRQAPFRAGLAERQAKVLIDTFLTYHAPESSTGLALSGANRPPQIGTSDGVLTAAEISSMQLEQTELVVLSACETGLGNPVGTEGVMSVQRAFLTAGVDTTIASQWEVDDYATRLLMEKFYRNLLDKKVSKLDALRSAQLDLLRNPKLIRDVEEANRGDRRITKVRKKAVDALSPHYWAAFSLSGDWR